MKKYTTSPEIFVGIDVSKAKLDLAIGQSSEFLQTTNDANGIKQILETLAKNINVAETALVVIEATGGYQVDVATHLSRAGYQVAVMNPRIVRDFAKGCGYLAKTDRIDARLLALYAERVKPEARPLTSAEVNELTALVTRRRQLVEMHTSETNREKMAKGTILKNIRMNIKWFEKQIETIDKEIGVTVEKSELWSATDELLQSVKGVGKTLSRTLMAMLPELGKLNRQEIAALVGVAPLNRDSGRSHRPRTTYGGRAPVRSVLYMATVSAVRWNTTIKQFHDQLQAKGKPYKVIIVACMRKLLTILNAMVKTQTHWNLSKASAI